MYIYIQWFTHRILFTHSSVDEHLGFFPLLALRNDTVMNIGVQLSV